MNTSAPEALRQLISIHHNRCAGYKLAATLSQQQDLQNLFISLSDQSVNFSRQLISVLGEEISSDDRDKTQTITAEPQFQSQDRLSLLSESEFAEQDATQNYEEVLNTCSDPQVFKVVEEQKKALHQNFLRIRNLYFTF